MGIDNYDYNGHEWGRFKENDIAHLRLWIREIVKEIKLLKASEEDTAANLIISNQAINILKTDTATKFKLEGDKVESLSKDSENEKVKVELLEKQLDKVTEQYDLLWHLVCDSGLIDCTKLPGATLEPDDGLGGTFNN